MKPYYSEAGITIYYADCADVLPTVAPSDVGLLLTDPPYGIGFVVPDVASGRAGASQTAGQRVVGDDAPFDPSPLLRFSRVVMFGGDRFSDRLPVGGWIVWDKTGGGKARTFMADAEMAWHNLGKSVSVFHHLWLGAFRDSEHVLRGIHPTQKPVALMRWILDKWTQPGDLVLDPYMGSGPVAQAAKEMGRRYLGVEIEERYCEIAVKRLAQEVLAL